MMTTIGLFIGFALIVTGLGLWNISAALVVGGLVLFVSAGLERRKGPQ
jgi:hypothetical protein